MKPRMVLMFIIFISVYLLLNFYIGWHGAFLLRYSGAGVPQGVYWIVFFLIAFSYLIGRARLLPGPAGRLFKVIGSYYFAVLEFSVLLLPLADLAAWLLHLGGVEASVYIPAIGYTVTAVMIVLLLWGSWNAWSPVVRTYPIDIRKKPGAARTLKIAVASDIHLGNLVGRRHLHRLVRRINAMEPDLILFPGDVIDDVIEPFIRNRMGEVMQQLKSRLGIYAVLGNHEYYGGHIEEYIRQMDTIGVRVLRDETVTLPGTLAIAGRKDKTSEAAGGGGRMSTEALLADLDKTLPIVLMDHQPYGFQQAAEAGADILLSGHTHRGQFAPNHFITRRLFELDWGYMRKGNLHVAVSSGFGTWGPPIRLASRSEIIQLVVTFTD
ncbi:metallophosphoesterase [Paenibacillus aurantius]|uniref:Metallophosphoesterase n=1 Tax=Paenibacillus aurantius TaxID=2918900 RepID=A0AA96RHC0_9BACL|nr:metallophosphoesterase [Paenibacillus aurantius]WNQ13872.1 metallophosphoesterase [Paenibacillus aurantius]